MARFYPKQKHSTRMSMDWFLHEDYPESVMETVTEKFLISSSISCRQTLLNIMS